MAAFSARTGGVSGPPFASLNLSEGVGDDPHAVRENRARLLGALGIDPKAVAFATQVHGATCLAPPGPGWAGTGDALVTGRTDVALAVGTADCMGVLAWDAAGTEVAAVHAGWRGMVAGALKVALETLLRHGVPPDRLRVALGPRIGPCCFVVGPEVFERFPPETRREADGRLTLDLESAARLQLRALGVADAAILDAGDVLPARACTSCGGERWFSHRRDRGVTGRAWALVTLRATRAGATHEATV